MEGLKKLIGNNFDIKGAIAPTIVVSCIFFINYFFFGMENTIIGPCVALSYLYFSNLTNHFSSILKTFLIYIFIALAAHVAGMSALLCVLVNAGVFFWLVYFTLDEYHSDNYYAPGMAFIMFQLSPVSEYTIFVRVEAVACSFAVAFLVMLLSFNGRNRNLIRKKVWQGFEICKNLIDAYDRGDKESMETSRDDLSRKNEEICDEIYLYNYADFKDANRVNWYCRFVSMFQVMITFSYEDRDEERLAVMRNLYGNLLMLFSADDWQHESSRLKIKRGGFDINSFKLRFALRMMIVMTPCMLYGLLAPFGNGFWLPVSVYFMMVPLYENMSGRVKGRIYGTLIGVVLCFLLYMIFPSLSAHIVIMTIANLLINAARSYIFNVAYLTCAVLALSITTDNIWYALGERLIYTFIGAAITIIACRFIFPVRIKPEEKYLRGKLDELKNDILLLGRKPYGEAESFRGEKDTILVNSYLLGRRLRLYNEALPKEEKNNGLLDELNDHMRDISYYLVKHFVGVRAVKVREE